MFHGHALQMRASREKLKKSLPNLLIEINEGLYEGLKSLEPFVNDKKKYYAILKKSKARESAFMEKEAKLFQSMLENKKFDDGDPLLFTINAIDELKKLLDTELEFINKEISEHTHRLQIGLE